MVSVVLVMYLYNRYNDLFTYENIFEFEPTNLWLVAAFFILLYVFKPITLIVPLWVLQVTCAMFFSTSQALILNTLGVALAITIAYFLGYHSGRSKVQDLYEKFRQKKSMGQMTEDGQFFYIFIIRIVGIISMDLSGMLMGSMRINFFKYFMASMAGLMPAVIIGTFIGSNASDPTSPGFIISMVLKGGLVLLSVILYRKRSKKANNQDQDKATKAI